MKPSRAEESNRVNLRAVANLLSIRSAGPLIKNDCKKRERYCYSEGTDAKANEK
jgi:hypothetical protein